MKIKSIKYNKRKQKCKVSFDDSSELELSTDITIKFGLIKNMDISEELLAKIIRGQRVYSVNQAALAYISYKPRTQKQISVRLRQMGFNKAETEEALTFLKQFDLQDDKKYADSFVKDYLLRKPVGKKKVLDELTKRGIPYSIAEESVNKNYPIESTLDLAIKSSEKKMKIIKSQPPDKQNRMLISHLQRLGFDWDTIKKVLSDYLE